MKNLYVDLKENGILFPHWVMANFRNYLIDKGKDVVDKKKTMLKLQKYQSFIGSFLDYKSPYRDILVYHGTGTGKTATTINVYNMLYNYTPDWNIFILIKAALRDEWLNDIEKWLAKNEKNERMKNIYFIHYDSPKAEIDFLDKMREADSSKQTMFVIEEAHSFISNVYNNKKESTGKRALTIYEYIIKYKMDRNCRIIALSATPGMNYPYELALLFNLLRPGIFPNSETKFMETYVSSRGGSLVINPETKNMFQRRIMGLVSYYHGADKELFAGKTIHVEDLTMTKEHLETYRHNENIENKLNRMSRGSSNNYMSMTRASCNFVFPYINNKINGDLRPKASKFRINTELQEKLDEGKASQDKISKQTKQKINPKDVEEYMNANRAFIKALIGFWDKIYDEDVEKKHTLETDVKNWKNSKSLQEYMNTSKTSKLLLSMYQSSPKMVTIVYHITKINGLAVVYSNFVKMEGLEIFRVYLNFFGFQNNRQKGGKDYMRFTEYHGGIKDKELKRQNRKLFNSKENRYGKNIKVILISPAGSEGINLMNVRQIHIMEPYWTEVRIIQVMGRGIRQKSHLDLLPEERHVDIYRYRIVRPNGKRTADVIIDEWAKSKYHLMQEFLTSLKEVAVDCKLFHKENNADTTDDNKYQCFQFNEETLFQNPSHPAYKMDPYYDSKISNGLNSTESKLMKIKVRKIQGVMENSNAPPKTYLYSEERGTVYDSEFHYPIGKIISNDSIPEKKDRNTYIIRNVIHIPH